jgi:hypothetical protein
VVREEQRVQRVQGHDVGDQRPADPQPGKSTGLTRNWTSTESHDVEGSSHARLDVRNFRRSPAGGRVRRQLNCGPHRRFNSENKSFTDGASPAAGLPIGFRLSNPSTSNRLRSTFGIISLLPPRPAPTTDANDGEAC